MKHIVALLILLSLAAQASPGARQELCSDLVVVVNHLPVAFDEVYSTSGFANAAALIEAATAQGGTYREAIDMLTNEAVEVAIATSANKRDLYMQGFRNYHEMQSSAGATSSSRNLIESAFLNMKYQNYVDLPAREKVIYGYLAPKPESGLASPRGIQFYGQDRWILKLNNIRSRITLFVGDSLNYLAPTVGAYDTEVKIQLDEWTQRFIPWSRRHIIAPLLAQGLSQGRVGLPIKILVGTEEKILKPATSPFFQPIPLADANGGKTIEWIQNYNKMIPIKSGPLKKFRCNQGWGLDYFEVQILGGVEVSDILAFEFTTTPPEGEFLKWLKANGIEIRDGRTS